MVYFIESYKPTRVIVDKILGKFGVESIRLSMDQHEDIARAFADEKTKVCIFESPTNPQLKIADMDFLCSEARKNNVITILDNTFAGFHKNKEHDIDIYIHSLTKYANGHGDGMGGVILGSEELLRPIFFDNAEFGPTMDPHCAYLMLRGMKNLPSAMRGNLKTQEK